MPSAQPQGEVCVSLWIPLSPSPSSAADMLPQHLQTSRRTQACLEPQRPIVKERPSPSSQDKFSTSITIYDSNDNKINFKQHSRSPNLSFTQDWTQHTILLACSAFGTLQLQNRQSLGFDLQHTIKHLQTWKHFQTVVQWWRVIIPFIYLFYFLPLCPLIMLMWLMHELTHPLKNRILGHLKIRRKFRQAMVAFFINSALSKWKDTVR